MKDIKTKEVTTKPKTKNPASRIPKELMRTAILESKEKSQTIANARDNDMGEQSLSEYASGKVTSAEESVSYTHLRAHETRHDLVCRLLLEKKTDQVPGHR